MSTSDLKHSVKRPTPISFTPRQTPTKSSQHRAMTEREITEYVERTKAERLAREAARIEEEAHAEARAMTVPIAPHRHLNDLDIIVGATVAVRVSGKFERCKVLDKGQMSHSGVWVYEVRPLDQTHTPTGRSRGFSIRRNGDIYHEDVANVGASVESEDESTV